MRKLKVLLWLPEHQHTHLTGLVTCAKELYEDQAYTLYAGCLNWRDLPDLRGIDACITLACPDATSFDAKAIACCVQQLHEAYEFDCLLFSSTTMERTIAARVAVSLGVGLTADVSAVEHRDGCTELIRPAFNGKLMAAIVHEKKSPLMASVRTDAFLPKVSPEQERSAPLLPFVISPLGDPTIRLCSIQEKQERSDIRDSEILVAGGGGIAKDFHQLTQLAELLGGQVAASRHVVDLGIAPRSIQVGQSGKTVSPKLYLAIGIYGSLLLPPTASFPKVKPSSQICALTI